MNKKSLKTNALTAKQNMIKNGYLNGAGAITPKGRNIIGNTQLYSLKKEGFKRW